MNVLTASKFNVRVERKTIVAPSATIQNARVEIVKMVGDTTCFNWPGPVPIPGPKEISNKDIPVINKKETNPKDAVGIKKAPISTLSGPVMAEMGLAMMEGALKYGRHNYRVSGVRASVYRDATFRHLNKWWEGQDIDPDSGLHHIIKAIAGLSVLYDSMVCGKCEDDRPPAIPNAEKYWADLDKKAAALIEKYTNPVAAFTEKNKNDKKSTRDE